MNTDSTDPSPPADKSWGQLARDAASEPAPADIDIRVALRAQLESLPASRETEAPSIWDDLIVLWQRNWFRASLAGCSVLTVGLAVAGVVALQDYRDFLNFAGPISF